MSEITDENLRTPSQRRSDINRVNAETLAGLCTDNPISPVRRLDDYLDEEREHDINAYVANPGAEDSEDEEEIAAPLTDAAVDRQEHIMDEVAVETSDYVPPEKNGASIDDEDDAMINVSNNATISGAPYGWKVPGPPANWKPNEPNTEAGEPPFEDVDNPGGWDQFTYKPKIDMKKKKYLYHCLPTGATPVPENSTGKRSIGDWNFVYDGSWKDDGTHGFRSGATKEDRFPESRKGSLSRDRLTLLGMTADRILEEDGLPDALFFYQLLLPIHNTNLTVPGDKRQSFYQDVSKWSNLYAIRDLQIVATGYGTTQDYVNPIEILST